MSPRKEEQVSPSRFRVSVIMRRQRVQHGRWSVPRWELVGLLAGEKIGDQEAQKQIIHADAESEQYLWTGHAVELYKDSAESYWYNLVSTTPSLFVVCREEDDEETAPFLVTASYDEADAYAEADDAVFSAPIPPEIYRWLEKYVVANYVPRERKKRKRKNWVED